MVKVYDSVYDTVYNETATIILGLSGGTCSLETMTIRKQGGSSDCGLFAIGISTALCYGLDPVTIMFDQVRMWPHHVNCFEKGALFASNHQELMSGVKECQTATH